MASWFDLKGTFQTFFNVGKGKTRFDASAPTTQRDFKLPDAVVDMTGGTVGQFLSKTGANTVGWASAGGGGSEAIGTVKNALSAPDASWLEANNIYLKATYPTFSTSLGDVPDLGNSYDDDISLTPPYIPASAAMNNDFCVYALGRYVAIGTLGHIITSTDGISWKSVPGRISSTLSHIIYANSLFVAVGSAGAILVSSDGLNFESASVVSSNNFNSVAFGAGVFVAVADTGIVYTSSDGYYWTVRTSGTANNLSTVVFANSIFVAGGASNTIISSPDGITWTARTGATGPVTRIIYANALFVALMSGTNVLTSPDGITWTVRTVGTPLTINAITFGGSLFVVVAGNTSAGTNAIATSPDGITWTLRTSPHNYLIYSVDYDGSQYIAVGNVGTTIKSSDGITWTPDWYDETAAVFRKIHCLNGIKLYFSATSNYSFVSTTKYYIGGVTPVFGTPQTGYVQTAESANEIVTLGLQTSGNNGGSVLRSTDGGVTWQAKTNGARDIQFGLAYGAGVFVSVGNAGTIYSSPDGITWTARTSGTANQLYGVIFANSLFVAFGQTGVITTSPDGITWTLRTSGVTGNLVTAVRANALYVVAGATSITTSPDGVTWTSRTSNAAGAIAKLIFANSLFVYVGSSGAIGTSSDGITWTARTSNTANSLSWIAYGAAIFVAIGATGTITTSSDGITWTVRTSYQTNNLLHIEFNSSRFVVSHIRGTINSSNGTDWLNGISPGSAVSTTTSLFYSTVQSAWYLLGYFNLKSTDGVNWTASDLYKVGSITSNSTATNGSVIVSASNTGGLFYSANGITWTRVNVGIQHNITNISYANGTFFALSSSTTGMYLTSSDGMSWTLRPLPVMNATLGAAIGLNAIAYGGATYVAVGSTTTPVQQVILTSTDGISWTYRKALTLQTYFSVVYGNSMFLVGCGAGIVLKSSDGITWTSKNIGSNTNVTRIIYDGSYFQMVTSGGGVFTSSDGENFNQAVPVLGTSALELARDSVSGFTIAFNINGFYMTKDGVNWTFMGNKNNIQTPITFPTNGQTCIFNDELYVIPQSRMITYGSNSLSKMPLYTYNKATHFYIPSTPTNGIFKSFVKAS